jgi:putative chitobiose transport system permease protein
MLPARALFLLALSVLIPPSMALLINLTASGLDINQPLHLKGPASLRRLPAVPMLLKVTGTTFLWLIGMVPPFLLGSLALSLLVNRQLPANS